MIRTIKPEAANIRTNAGKVIVPSPVVVTEDSYNPSVQRLRTNAGKLIVSSQILPQTKTISYVADGNYRGVFYEIGTKLQSVAYSNPCFFNDAFRVSFIFDNLLSNSQSLSPHRLLERPSNLSSARNPFHTSNNGTTYITVSLPSGWRLKPTGFAMQSRTDFNQFHTSSINIFGCNNVSNSVNNYSNLGDFNTGFTSGATGQWYVNTGISTSTYFNVFRLTRNSNTDDGVYFTGNFFEFFGELKIYE